MQAILMILIAVAAVALGALLLCAAVLAVMAIAVYESAFHRRYTSNNALRYTLEELPDLKRETFAIPTRGGHSLAGYRYTAEGVTPRAVLVLAHGLGGGGHSCYIDLIAAFARRGYLVYTYDVTGNDQSPGASVQGLPRGVVDLDHALTHLKRDRALASLPILLFGHSWGGYSVGAVPGLQKGIAGVVSLAGFDRASLMLRHRGRERVGGAICLLMPFVSLYERLKFGRYAACSVISGIAKSDARVMLLHSEDDTVVPAACGFDRFAAAFSDCPRVTLLRLSGRGHDYLLVAPEARAYRASLEEQWIAYAKAEGVEGNEQARIDFLLRHMDKRRYYAADEALMSRICAFYDACIEERKNHGTTA